MPEREGRLLRVSSSRAANLRFFLLAVLQRCKEGFCLRRDLKSCRKLSDSLKYTSQLTYERYVAWWPRVLEAPRSVFPVSLNHECDKIVS